MTQIPQVALEAAERIRRGDKQGPEWVYFHCATRGELKEFDQYLVAIKHPLAYQAGTQLDRLRVYAYEIA